MKALILKAISNLKYESTLSGITLLAGVAGAHLAPDHLAAIATATFSVIGALKLLLSDADAAAKDAQK